MARTVGVGISGGIASYKIADLVSRLRKADINVVVMMTKGACEFISPMTFETLSGRDVLTDVWDDTTEWKIPHIDIAEELDLLVVAPATANIIAKLSHGIADDLLSTVAVANTAPILIVPAMNSNMYANPVVQDNIKILKSYDYVVMEPDSGILACGAEGKGRLPDVESIYEQILQLINPVRDLEGKTIMVNAGTTCENIDPVRFIANRGTGKMGFAIAEEASKRGADVILVSGSTNLSPPLGVKYLSVWSADEMCETMLKYQSNCDVIVGAAAVGDFKVANVVGQKIKKKDDCTEKLVLELVGCPDILQELGKCKREGQVMVGFAAETEHVLENARKKLEKKNLDFIVANDVTMEGAGFATDTNIVTFISRNGDVKSLPKMSKSDVAVKILDRVVDIM